MTDAWDWAAEAADASEMIAEVNLAATIKRPVTTGPAHNPTIGTPASHACLVVVTEFSNQEIDGSRVLATDKKVILATQGLTITPLTSDKITLGGVDHSIVRVEPLAPGGVTVLWTLQCRK